jgi:hypothetical protein
MTVVKSSSNLVIVLSKIHMVNNLLNVSWKKIFTSWVLQTKKENKIQTKLNLTNLNIKYLWHMKLGHINKHRLKKSNLCLRDWDPFMRKCY